MREKLREAKREDVGAKGPHRRCTTLEEYNCDQPTRERHGAYGDMARARVP